MNQTIGRAMHWVLLTYFVLSLAAGETGNPPGPRKLQHDVTDSFKIWQIFDSPVAISDSNNDTVFECVAAWRTAIDPEARTAVYAMDFGVNGLMDFFVKPGDSPATYVITVEDEPEPFQARYYYTDYENCVITDLDFHGYTCMLWTTKTVKDNVPQLCIDQFVDTCGVVAPKHSRDLCPDGEGDYK
ncbi:uncharacterized protein LOC144151939 [Haemaphysalis longicornis]